MLDLRISQKTSHHSQEQQVVPYGRERRGVTSDFAINVTLCNNFLSHYVIITEWIRTKDLKPVAQDPGFWKPEPRT